MASWRTRLKLPSFKVTQRAGGTVVHRTVPRGRVEHMPVVTDEDQSCDEAGPDTHGLDEMAMEGLDDNSSHCLSADPSLHSIKQKASVAAWTEIRRALRCAAIESSAMRTCQCCIICSERASYRCLQCAAWAFYCPACFYTAHSKVNLFHTGEVWTVGHVCHNRYCPPIYH